MTAKTQLDLIEAVLEGTISIREAIRICEVYEKDNRTNDLKPLPFHLDENEKSQKFVQREFIKVNVPKFEENPNAIHITKLNSKIVQKSFRESPRGKEWNKAQLRGNLHYRPKMKTSYVPFGEKINDRPEIKPKEIITKSAEIKKELADREFYRPINNVGRYSTKKRIRAERKLSVAKLMAEMPNATNQAIERYQYMQLADKSNYWGLPTTYLNRENVRYR